MSVSEALIILDKMYDLNAEGMLDKDLEAWSDALNVIHTFVIKHGNLI